MDARPRPPTTADLLIGSVSQYNYDRHEHKATKHHPEFPLNQTFTHTMPGQPLDDRRGETLLVNRAHEPLLRAGPKPDVVPDPRDSIRRHFPKDKHELEARNRKALQHDREALRFKAYFEEQVIGSAIEERRTRVLQVVWYPHTDELRLFEPRENNAGLVQGEFLRRGKHLLAGAERPVRLDDFCKCGQVLQLQEPPLELTIIDADAHTRKWLVERGFGDFGEARKAPPSYKHPATLRTHDWGRPTKVSRDQGFEANAALGFYSRAPDVRGRFEQARGRVLRFEGLLDQRHGSQGSGGGDLLVVAVHYFLEDETMEVICPEGINDGLGKGASKLLSRQRVPVDVADVDAHGAPSRRAPVEMLPAEDAAMTLTGMRPATAAGSSSSSSSSSSFAATATMRGGMRTAPGASSRARLGLVTPAEAAEDARRAHARHRGRARYRFSPGSWSGTYVSPITGRPLYGNGGVADALDEGARSAPVTHVTPDLLRAGGWITVFGRRIWLRRADAFTAAWYRESMGVEQEEHAGEGPIVAPAPRRGAEADVPPHVGIAAVGDEEETRHNASKLVPTWRAKPDFTQFFECDGKVLNFRALLVDPCPQDEDRQFIISFFLVDNTLAINEVQRPNAGRWGIRFLERGKYRNARAPAALPPGVSADNSISNASDRATAMARERALGGMGDVYGYGHGFGQGYAGGALGRADRAGAGCTGVPSARGVGIRERVPFTPSHPFFQPGDICVGDLFEMAHAPGLVFKVHGADSFTKRWLVRNGFWSDPDGEDATDGDAAAPAARKSEPGSKASFTVATSLAGCLASVRRGFLTADKRDTGTVSVGAATRILARYGACPPAVSSADVAAVLMEHSVSGSAPRDGDGDGDSEEPRVRWHALCDALVRAAQDAAAAGLTASQGSPEEGARIEQQLRSAVLSSRKHLRHCFRELGREIPGAITPREFRHLLRRHHLDLGMTAYDVAATMRRYPAADEDEIAEESEARGVPAPPTASIPEGCISCRGFLWTLAGGSSGAASVSPGEVAEVENIVRGIARNLKDGAGHAPEYHPHAPRASAWGKPRIAWADGTGAGWKAKDVSAKDSIAIRDRMRDTVLRDAEPERKTPEDTQPPAQQAEPEVDEKEPQPEPEGEPEGETGVRRNAVMRDLSRFFQGKTWDLHHTMRLYDPTVRGQMSRRAFSAALASAGYRLSSEEEEAVFGTLPADGPVNWRIMVAELTSTAFD